MASHGVDDDQRSGLMSEKSRMGWPLAALVVSPPSTRTDANDLAKRASEGRLIREPRVIGDVSE
jgi:hypothetical protein